MRIVSRWANVWWCLFSATLLADEPGSENYPTAPSKKGLQVQMVDDALELGIHHAALNLNLGQLIEPDGGPQSIAWQLNGQTYHFSRGYVTAMDGTIKSLSDQGINVSLILLSYEPGDGARRRILLHPGYSKDCPNRLSAFNTVTEEGRDWFHAALDFMAARWSDPTQQHGRVWNWIIGNEVNSHWYWCNLGRATMQQFADDYLTAVRIACHAIHAHQPEGRVFVSLEHHWNIGYPAGDEQQVFAARPFLEYLAEATRDDQTPWHVAFHPYPENLFEPRTWRDQSATEDWRTTPRITFRNLEQLTLFLQQPEMLLRGQPRRVILSEQGFHTPEGEQGEWVQAAAYVYAWRKVNALEGIDSFILHRHVDHAHEGGLRLGLWTRRADSVATPERRKPIWSVFQAAGTAEEEVAFQFADAVISTKD